MYEKIPFDMMIVGATFQREMVIAFVGEKEKFIVIYLDDLTIFSKSNDDHLKHLRKTFVKCKKYGLLLNPKKSHFVVQEGKLHGHIVSKEGVKIDPQHVEEIKVINLQRNKQEIQSFLGKIIFLRRFIPNFA
jgi:SNF2 family DNA or RNA helicase